MLGIVLGLTLISGQLLNAYSVSSTPTSQIPQWDFGFAKVNMIGYQAQVIPAILAAVTLGLLERFFRKICPEVLSMIVVPFVLTVVVGKKKGVEDEARAGAAAIAAELASEGK